MSAPSPTSSRAGFTLIEVLAVLFLTALVLSAALSFYIDLSNDSTRATEATREVRRATTLIDRIARDLERAVLVKKPEDVDPLAHPWIFLAEPHIQTAHTDSQSGSDRLKFMLRSEPPRTQQGPTSDLSTIAYTLEQGEDGETYELHRWSSPHLPERLDREFPPPDDPASLVLADGISHFALRFLGEGGEWLDRWDSSQLVESSELPVAVEIELALAPQNGNGEGEQEPLLYGRRVLLPMRPIDLVALLDPNQSGSGDGDDEECESGLSLADCIDWSKAGGGLGGAGGGGGGGGGGPLGGGGPGGGGGGGDDPIGQFPAGTTPADVAAIADLIANAPNECWDNYRALYAGHPAIKPQCK
jgi:prepilin-type N-terminal cleavage/methylation domain-containing protein